MERSRQQYIELIQSELNIFPICALLGPRQCGKTTLARQFASTYQEPVHYFDLEDYTDLAKLDNPKIALDELEGLIIIDEVQLRPSLFSYLRVLVDKKPIKIILLGSASRDLLQQGSETLAGRISFLDIAPFSLQEVNDQKTLWTRGGFPRSFLAATDESSFRWRQAYVQTYFEKDLRTLGVTLPPRKILNFWNLLAHFHANVVNYAEMARFMELPASTIKNYLGLIEGTFLIRTLAPWHVNMKKRLVKSPKLYIRDSGIYHLFQNLTTYQSVIHDLKRGPSWEGFALEEVIKALRLRTEECYFWATHQEAEMDLVTNYKGKMLGFEFKSTDSPAITKSLRMAQEALNLDHIYIVTPIEESFPLEKNVTVVALKDLSKIHN
jgi:hypothetical protein